MTTTDIGWLIQWRKEHESCREMWAAKQVGLDAPGLPSHDRDVEVPADFVGAVGVIVRVWKHLGEPDRIHYLFQSSRGSWRLYVDREQKFFRVLEGELTHLEPSAS